MAPEPQDSFRQRLNNNGPSPIKGGAGYKNSPHKKVPLPIGAKWATPIQVCDRYGGKSDMWLWRKIKNDPNFPKPFYMGRRRLFLVVALDAYDQLLIQKAAG